MDRDIIADFNSSEEIFIRNPEELKQKILSMRADGKLKLNIFSDFDCTLTRKFYNNERADHSFKAIENVFPIYYRNQLSERSLWMGVSKLVLNICQSN